MNTLAPHWLTLIGIVLLTLAWYPPFAPLLFVALVPLLLLEERLSLRRFWGWTVLMFLGWNVGAIWWLWNASSWFTLGAWGANAFLMSLPVVLFSLTRRLSDGRFRFLPFVMLWLGFEYLHQNWGLTFPWLNLGNALGTYPAWAQWYEYTGTLGGSLWFLVGNILAYQVLVGRSPGRAFGLGSWILLPVLYSLYLFYTFEPQSATPVEVVLVQPNLDCYAEKFARNPQTGKPSTSYVPYAEQVNRLQHLAEEQVTPNTRFVAFPETALHKNIEEGYLLINKNPEYTQLQNWLRTHPGLTLITGIDSYYVYKAGETPSVTARQGNGFTYDKYNTALFLLPSGEHEFYHKSKLVIGAEATPFRTAMPVALKDMSGNLGIQPEREVFPHPQDSTNLKAAPVICFESVYGEFVTEYEGTNLIFVITNDGWWGRTPGYRQHLRFSQLRAIEIRRPVARSANTGVSCFIDARGAITQKIGYEERGALRGTVMASSARPTFYARYGDYIGRLAAFLGVAFLLSAYIRKLRN